MISVRFQGKPFNITVQMRKQWKQCQTLFFGLQITADGDCSHEIKRRLLLGRKVMTNLDSILKSRDTDLQNSLLDSVGESEGGVFQENSIETCILSRVKQITSPGWMHETSSQIWCTGKTQGDRLEREVGGGIGMGNTCTPMAVSFQCMTKFTTN